MKIFNMTKATPKVYDPIWRCIYCGSDDTTQLSKEHIIPIGLQNGAILRKASCESCRRITERVETMCLRKALLPYRWHAGFVSHKKQIPKTIPLGIRFDRNPHIHHIPIDHHPDCLLLPRLQGLPSMISGKGNLTASFPPKIAVVLFNDTIDQAEASTKLLAMRHMYDFNCYWRMIAKIAHSFAIAEIGLGLDGFQPTLPDLILGRNQTLAPVLIGD
jgi:hypothetical protein